MKIEIDLTVDEVKRLVDFRQEVINALKSGHRTYSVQDELSRKVLISVSEHPDFNRLFKGD